VAYLGGFGGSTPPPKFRRPSKIVPNSTRLWKMFKIAEFRAPTLQDVRKKGSKILKLQPVHNCFTLAMTNKLVVIINSLKIPKIKEILLYEMTFLVPNYSCLQNPWLGGYRPQIPFLSALGPHLNLLTPPRPNKIPGYATGGGGNDRYKVELAYMSEDLKDRHLVMFLGRDLNRCSGTATWSKRRGYRPNTYLSIVTIWTAS